MGEFEQAGRLPHKLFAAAFMLVGFGVVGAIALNAEVPRPEANAQPEFCQQADRAVVVRLQPLLERTDAKASAVSAQAMRNILAARTYCGNGYAERGVALYREVDMALTSFHAAGKVAYGR